MHDAGTGIHSKLLEVFRLKFYTYTILIVEKINVSYLLKKLSAFMDIYIYSETCISRNRMGPKIFSTLDKFPHYTK
jgi:hypothetical protein